MILDTSAIIAIINFEPERAAFVSCIVADNDTLISAVTVVEAGMVIGGRFGLDSGSGLDRWLESVGATQVPFTAEHATLARAAWRSYGKGRHTAALNFGDCCVYALAKALDQQILCKGNDFARTDIGVVHI